MTLTTLELTRHEALLLLSLVQAKVAEMDRMLQALDEGEGEDLQRHQARRAVRPQAELLADLALKLEGASKGL